MLEKFGFEEKIIQDISLLMVRDDFSAEVKKLHEKYDYFFANYDTTEDGEPLGYEKEWNEFGDEISKLREQFKLSEMYDSYLDLFIQTGKLIKQHNPGFIHLNPYNKVVNEKNCVTIQIFPETSREDIIDNWPRIKRAVDALPVAFTGRKNKIENLERDLEIFQLKKDGLSSKETAKKINEKYKEVVLGYSDIPVIIKRLKDRANKIITSKKS